MREPLTTPELIAAIERWLTTDNGAIKVTRDYLRDAIPRLKAQPRKLEWQKNKTDRNGAVSE